jgi:hypothetical protein
MMVHIVKICWDESHPLTVEEVNDNGRDNEETNTGNTLKQNFGDAIPSYLQSRAEELNAVLVETALLRNSESVSGLYAYSFSNIAQSSPSHPNIRATRLAMACGLHSQRFTGDVYIGRLGYVADLVGHTKLMNLDLCIHDVQNACDYSPDLRHEILAAFNVDGDVASPEWLENAAQRNYHDGASLAALATAMTRAEIADDDEESDEAASLCSDETTPSSMPEQPVQTVLTKIPLCWHCRGPASTLCPGCDAVYFCDASRRCQVNGWSHQCLCKTWKLYVDHRDELSSFPYFSGWQTPLLQKDCFTSENTYESFLIELGVIASQDVAPKQTWWTTELYGWAGGASISAKDVDVFHRVSFEDGFALENKEWIPQESHVTTDDADVKFDEHGLPILNSWQDWYRLRKISSSSPVALLATFPLTLYYAIQHYGCVPLTVATMLERPMRVHVVGIEKELNFVDLFREVGYLLPKDNIKIDMTWIVREDMLPQNSKGGKSLSLQLTSNVTLTIVAGTYGDSLDPDFDFNGSPDMIVGMNAGLYAYDSWRHVVTYLYTHPNVIGVFTDYNEHSGLNCASLGGSKSRKSLSINPFRQPRTMPVYCMNLPQFSNGFVYIFNEQELE